MNPNGARLAALVVALALGWFLWLRMQSGWTHYWLLQDAQKGTAIITGDLWSGHDAVGYRYVVGQNQYDGRSSRDWQDKRYSKVQMGQESPVYFSASHPWLSLLYVPRGIVDGLPVIIVVVILETLALLSIINPKSRWAFSFASKGVAHATEHKNA